jgi:histidinol-phosphatase (PHP family)
MIPLDYHIHTTYSCDSSCIPEDVCNKAIQLGIPEIGFSEHWDVGPYEDHPRFLQVESWWAELKRLSHLFQGQLVIRSGIEIAQPHLYPVETAEVLSRCPFDYVLGSVHFVGSHFMFDESYFKAHTPDEVYESYFNEVERMLVSADIDIVAHLDIPARTAIPIFGFDPYRYEKQIRHILGMVIDRGLALDINTAGLRNAAGNLMPDPTILGWFAEMGGGCVTLGSDAHKINQVGLHLDEGLSAIKEAGISHISQFEHRQSRPLPIE